MPFGVQQSLPPFVLLRLQPVDLLKLHLARRVIAVGSQQPIPLAGAVDDDRSGPFETDLGGVERATLAERIACNAQADASIRRRIPRCSTDVAGMSANAARNVINFDSASS
jgi:hypothetical protein